MAMSLDFEMELENGKLFSMAKVWWISGEVNPFKKTSYNRTPLKYEYICPKCGQRFVIHPNIN